MAQLSDQFRGGPLDGFDAKRAVEVEPEGVGQARLGFFFLSRSPGLFGVQVAQHPQGDHMPRFSRHVFHDRLGICPVSGCPPANGEERRHREQACEEQRPSLRQPFPPRPPKGRESLHRAGCWIGLEGGQANLDQLRGGLHSVPVCTDQRQRLDDLEARVPSEHLDGLGPAQARVELRGGRTVERANRQDFPALWEGVPG